MVKGSGWRRDQDRDGFRIEKGSGCRGNWNEEEIQIKKS